MNTDGALRFESWANELDPADAKRDFILSGVKNGFKILDESLLQECTFTANYHSATNPTVKTQVESQIISEINNKRYYVVHDKPTIVSALGAIPKKNSSKFRLIHDCSRPEGKALNDFAENIPFKYQCISDAVNLIQPQYYMAKVDLMHAYRSVKVHESNWCATGLQWTFEGNKVPTFLVDTRLPFGARSSPYIFNELTQAVRRILEQKYNIKVIAYLDDFLIISEDKASCSQALTTLLAVLRKLGFSINYNKVSPPSQRLTFLGIVLDSVSMSLELPQEKLSDLKTILIDCVSRTKITKKSLQSLAGLLNWACQCIYGGRFHMRRIQERINTLKAPWHRTRVTVGMKADIYWWINFLDIFNGQTKMLDDRPAMPIHIDACGIAGGSFHDGMFVYTPWNKWLGAEQLHINYKETLSLEPAVTNWAPRLANKKVIVLCDNKAAVGIINRGTSKEPFVMDSLRRIFWLSAIHNFRLEAVYVPGKHNNIADAVSRLHEPGGPVRLLKTVFPDNPAMLQKSQ